MTENEKKVVQNLYEALKASMGEQQCPVRAPCTFCGNYEICGATAKLFRQVEKKLEEGA